MEFYIQNKDSIVDMPRPGFEPGSSARKAGILDLAIRPGLAYYIQLKIIHILNLVVGYIFYG